MDKKFLFLGFGIVLAVALMVFVLADIAFSVSPINYGNYSTTILFNVSTDLNASATSWNATIYYNVSNGNASTFLTTLTNGSVATVFTNGTLNASVSVAGLADGKYYNFSVFIQNTSDSIVGSVYNVTIDNTPPAVVNFTNTLAYYNYSQVNDTLILNVSVTDPTMGVAEVWFNITNSTASVPVNFSIASTPGGGYYNATWNISGVPAGKYNITVFTNDTQLLNLNNTEKIQITIDNVAPSAVTLTSSSTDRNSLTINVAIAEALSGIGNACVSSRSGATITGAADSTQTFVESGLDCNTAYAYTITCTDLLGNSKSSASTSFTTAGCIGGDSTSSGGGGGASIWTNTYNYANQEFSVQGSVTKALTSKNRIKLRIDSESHYIGVKSLTSTTATIEIASTPQTEVFNVGEIKKFDVTDDGFYDISVRLNSITGGKVDITILSIHEKEDVALAPEDSNTTTGDGDTTTTPEDIVSVLDEGTNWTWVWIIIIVLIVLIGVGIGIGKKKKK